MFKYACLNNISQKGLDKFSDQYQLTDDLQEANGILVRSASMHGMELSDEVLDNISGGMDWAPCGEVGCTEVCNFQNCGTF